MLILDTDHLSVIDAGRSKGAILLTRLDESLEEVAATVISAEEQMRGWMAQIHRESNPHQQIAHYERFQRRLLFYSKWNILPWNDAAADGFLDLKRQRIRIGTMDLKIAAIALANDAMVLTRNLRDFREVPNLKVENWLD